MTSPSAALLALLGAALLAVWLWIWLLQRRRNTVPTAPPPADRWSDLPEVHWVEEQDSPLGRRVLDCRGYCRLMDPAVKSPAIAQRFDRTIRSDLAEVAGQLPEDAPPDGLRVCWHFDAAEWALLRAGFIAQVLLDKWMIRSKDDRLYIQRSWTGTLMYVAELQQDPSPPAGGGRIVRLWLHRKNKSGPDQRLLSVALCRYLIDSHVLGRPAAVPVPGDLAGDTQKMALFAFSVAGRHGDYAEPFWPEVAAPLLGLVPT